MPLPGWRLGGLEQVDVDPNNASRKWWQKFHTYRRVRHAEVKPDDPLTPDQLTEELMKQDDSFRHRRLFAVDDGEALISTFGASTLKPSAPGYESNKHLLSGGGYVLPQHRRHGVGRSWIPVILDLMDEFGSTVFTTGSDQEDGHGFLIRFGAEAKLRDHENRLDLTRSDWPMIRRWVEEGKRRNPETHVTLYQDRLPIDVVAEYCRALSEMENTRPFDDLDHGEILITPSVLAEKIARLATLKGAWCAYVAWEPGGVISGMTEVIHLPFEKDRIQQWFTGVGTAFRGRGLGKLLKAAMLEHIAGTYRDVKWIITGNANSNEPILAINRKLGFRPYRACVIYQISKQKLRLYASGSSRGQE